MKTIAEIRYDNLALIQRSFASAVEFANRIGISQSYLSQLTAKGRDGKHRKNLGEKMARKVELALNLASGWLDTPQLSFPPDELNPIGPPPGLNKPRVSSSRVSGIQNALVETAQRLVLAGLLSDLDCLALLQGWQPLIAKLNESSTSP